MRKHLAIASLFLALGIQAQLLQPIAVLDTSEIRVGEQTVLTLRIAYDTRQPNEIEFPIVNKQIGERVELVEEGEIMSDLPDQHGDPNTMVRSKELTITVWDSGFAALLSHSP